MSRFAVESVAGSVPALGLGVLALELDIEGEGEVLRGLRIAHVGEGRAGRSNRWSDDGNLIFLTRDSHRLPALQCSHTLQVSAIAEPVDAAAFKANDCNPNNR